jgi:hypothetical protein
MTRQDYGSLTFTDSPGITVDIVKDKNVKFREPARENI